MKTLYLHIGTPKTGTSSLQQFCMHNRAALHAQGCDYPVMSFRYRDVGKERNGCFLTVGTRGDTLQERKENTRKLEMGLETVRERFLSFDTVIVSDEGLWSALADQLETFWEPLLTHAGENGYTVKVLVYLRRQDQQAASRYNQMIKTAERQIGMLMPEEWMDGLGAGRLDYCGTLDRIASHTGRENIIVRVYDRAKIERNGGSIFDDFLSCVGISLDSSFHMPARDENADALSLNMLAIKRSVNRLSGHTRDHGIDRNFNKAAKACSANAGADRRMSLFSYEEACELLDRHRAGNDRIAREYLHRDGPLFDMKLVRKEKWSADNPWMFEDTVCYFRALAGFQNEEIRSAGQEERSGSGAASGMEDADFSVWLDSVPDSEEDRSDYERTVYFLGGYFLMRQKEIAAGEAVCPLEPERAAGYAAAIFLIREKKEFCRAIRLLEERDNLAKQLEETRKRLDAAERRLAEKEKMYEQELSKVKASTSWRVGRAVTWLPRRLKDAVR